MIIYRPARRVRIVSPDLVEKLIASYDFARARRQKSQDRKLLAGHVEGRAVTAGFISAEVDLNAAREYGQSGVLSTLTNADQQLDQANRAKAVSDLRQQASAEVPMRLARQAARQAVERSFAMPLLAAGFKDAKVVARFPTEGTDDPSYLDLSTPYEQVIQEAERKRAAQGH